MTLGNYLHFSDIIMIFLYLAGMILIGYLAGKKVKSSSDFTNAGQSLTWPFIAGSTIATTMGANMVIGKYDLIYEFGLSGLTASLFWWVGWIFLLLMAKPLRRSGAVSLPHFLKLCYGKKTRKLSSLCVLITSVSSCAAQFLTIGVILEALGICGRNVGTWIGALLIILFVVFSGLWGVAMTDTIQSVILLICFGVIFPLAVFRTAGGWEAVASFNSGERLNMFRGISPLSMLGWAVYYSLSTGSDPAIAQRILSSKSEKDAFAGQLIAWAFTLVVVGFVSALPGLAIRQIMPDLAAGSQFTPLYLVKYMPAILRGFMLAALLGLMLTSGDTYLLLLVSTVTDDLILPNVKQISEKRLMKLNRILCCLSAVLITAMALYVNSIYQLFKTGGGAYGAGIFFPLLLGCFGKKADSKFISLGMTLGCLVSFCFDMFFKIPLGLDIDGCVIGAGLCAVLCLAGLKNPG